MQVVYTVSRESLEREAARIEAYANDSMRAWLLLGQSDRYSAEMRMANSIRNAAQQRSPAIRREIMRNLGFTIRSPKTIRV